MSQATDPLQFHLRLFPQPQPPQPIGLMQAQTFSALDFIRREEDVFARRKLSASLPTSACRCKLCLRLQIT